MFDFLLYAVLELFFVLFWKVYKLHIFILLSCYFYFYIVMFPFESLFFYDFLICFFQMQNCSCISLSNQTSLSTATSGLCADQECANGGAITFLAFMFLAIFLIFSIAIPGLQATIRIVLFTQRSFAVGVQVGFLNSWVCLSLQ